MSERFDIFTIIEREGYEKKIWLKIGTAFPNKDGSFNGFLDALPVNGTIHIRLYQPKDDEAQPPRRDQRGGNQRPQQQRQGQGQQRQGPPQSRRPPDDDNIPF